MVLSSKTEMRRPLFLLFATLASTASASIFLHGTSQARSFASMRSSPDAHFHRKRNRGRTTQKRCSSNGDAFGDAFLKHQLAMAIPGNGVAEQVIIGGFGNFIAIYNSVITVRILLSWFPQAASVGAL